MGRIFEILKILTYQIMKSSNLVTTSMLAEHLEDPDWIIIDCRFNLKFPEKGEKDYQEEHILGALYVHLDRDLAGPVQKGRSGRHPLPDPQTCIQTFSSLGINDGKEVSIKPKKINQNSKRLWGMNRSLINNAIIGTSIGYEKILELTGVGFRASLKGKQLNLQLGFSHDINYDIPERIKITVEKQTIIKVVGPDKQQVGMVASQIKSFRAPEPYKGKGIKEQGQYILRKVGKKK